MTDKVPLMRISTLLETPERDGGAPHTPRLARLIWLLAGLALVATGGVLWWSRGERVFADMVSASLAWCM